MKLRISRDRISVDKIDGNWEASGEGYVLRFKHQD
jgi:hypothetical protein